MPTPDNYTGRHVYVVHSVEVVNPDAMWERFLHDLPCERAALVPEPRRLSAAEASAKLAAMQTYASQFAALDSAPVGRLSHPVTHGHEVVWSVAPLPPVPPRGAGPGLRSRARRASFSAH